MKWIAWDTSSKSATLTTLEFDRNSKAGFAGVRVLSEWNLDNDLQHSERLLWAVHEILKASRWEQKDLSGIGVGVGPGSFTGIRIGVTTARTLAQALGIPVVGVSSLAALARGVSPFFTKGRTVLIAATDACKGELFAVFGAARSLQECVAKAQGDSPGAWKRGIDEGVFDHDVLIRQIKRKLLEGAPSRSEKRTPWIVIGEAQSRYPKLWDELPRNSRIQIPEGVDTQTVRGRVLAQLVWEGVQMGLATPYHQLHPRYLRVSDAEKKLNASAK